jgi:uncharacterized protein (DUF58 family)
MKELKLNLKPMVKKFEIFTKKNSISELSGNYTSLFKGKGLDFSGYRNYTHIDDASEIDWKASMRAGETLIKVMEEERNSKIFFLFDVSNSMLFASHAKLKCEYAAEIVASLSFTILRAGDSVGMVMFSDKINKIMPLSMGPQHYYNVIKELSNPVNYGGNFDLGKTLKYVNEYLERNSVVILVSDFIGLDGSWRSHFKIASKKFDFLFLIMVRDPVDNRLPDDTGQITLEDPFSETKLLVDPIMLGSSYNSRSNEIKNKAKAEFKKAGVDILELETDKDFEKDIARFFVRSRRKWR